MIPVTPSSPDDSITQAWRSSTQGCFDVPDSSISPYKSSFRGKGKGRLGERGMQSAPDILKYSPPTPSPSSPTRQNLVPIAYDPPSVTPPSLTLSPAKRSRASSARCTPSPRTKVARERTSPTAPTLASNASLVPAKRLLQPARIVASVQPRVPTPTSTAKFSPTPHPSLKALPSDVTCRQEPLQPTDVTGERKRKRKRDDLKPLSLRSRLKLAARRTKPTSPLVV